MPTVYLSQIITRTQISLCITGYISLFILYHLSRTYETKNQRERIEKYSSEYFVTNMSARTELSRDIPKWSAKTIIYPYRFP